MPSLRAKLSRALRQPALPCGSHMKGTSWNKSPDSARAKGSVRRGDVTACVVRRTWTGMSRESQTTADSTEKCSGRCGVEREQTRMNVLVTRIPSPSHLSSLQPDVFRWIRLWTGQRVQKLHLALRLVMLKERERPRRGPTDTSIDGAVVIESTHTFSRMMFHGYAPEPFVVSSSCRYAAKVAFAAFARVPPCACCLLWRE